MTDPNPDTSDAVRMNVAGMTTISKRERTALRAKLTEVEGKLDHADQAIQAAAMAMGSTDEWVDQGAMIQDFEQRFHARDATIAELRALLNEAKTAMGVFHYNIELHARIDAALKSSEPTK